MDCEYLSIIVSVWNQLQEGIGSLKAGNRIFWAQMLGSSAVAVPNVPRNGIIVVDVNTDIVNDTLSRIYPVIEKNFFWDVCFKNLF